MENKKLITKCSNERLLPVTVHLNRNSYTGNHMLTLVMIGYYNIYKNTPTISRNLKLSLDIIITYR